MIPAVAAWLAGLDPQDPDHAHHLVEALWVYQAQDMVNEPLLDRVLASPEPKARAAGTRVLSFWRERAGDVYGRLGKLAADEHPRVRLEAVRALSFFRDQRALTIAIESLVMPQDDYLSYVFNETIKTLSRRVPAAVAGGASGSARPLDPLLSGPDHGRHRRRGGGQVADAQGAHDLSHGTGVFRSGQVRVGARQAGPLRDPLDADDPAVEAAREPAGQTREGGGRRDSE